MNKPFANIKNAPLIAAFIQDNRLITNCAKIINLRRLAAMSEVPGDGYIPGCIFGVPKAWKIFLSRNKFDSNIPESNLKFRTGKNIMYTTLSTKQIIQTVDENGV